MRSKIVTYEWFGKLYTSQLRLWELSREGAIRCDRVPEGSYGERLTFFTNAGDLIASFYSDNTQGFSSQATGIELKNAIPNLINHPEAS